MDPRLLLIVALIATSVAIGAYLLFQRFGTAIGEQVERYRAGVGTRLRKARNPFSTERFQRIQRTLTAASALFGALLGDGLGGRGFVAGVFAAFCWLACDQYLTFLWRRYQRDFAEQLADMIAVIGNAVKAGNSVQQALELVVEEFSDPMASEVREVLHELRVGTALDVAIRNWLNRMPNDDLEIFGIAVIIQRQTGGNLGEILENLAQTMRERKKMQGQIRSLTTQGRFSGIILSLLPVGLYVVMYLLLPERMGLMFTHPLGWAMVALCVVMIGTGGFLITRIVAIDV